MNPFKPKTLDPSARARLARSRSGLMTAFYLYIVVCLAIAAVRTILPGAPHPMEAISHAVFSR